MGRFSTTCSYSMTLVRKSTTLGPDQNVLHVRTSPRIPKLVTEFPFFFSGGIKLLLLSVVAMRSVFFFSGVGTSNGRQKNAPFLVAFFFLAGFEGVG